MASSRAPPRLYLSRIFSARADAVFRAWTQPDLMRRWMFVSPTNRIENVVVEQRVGGRFSIVARNGDEVIDHSGEYLELDWPRRLAFTLEVPKRFPGVTCVTVEIEPRGAHSLMEFWQAGVDPRITERPWQAMFETLAQLIQRSEP